MSRIERTPEERKLFYDGRFEVLNALTEVQEYDGGSEENKKAMMALIDAVAACNNLVDVCGNLAGLAVRQGEVKMGPDNDAPKRLVTTRDIRVLGAALWNLLKKIEADTPKTPEGRPEQTPNIIRVRKAISRVKPVELFYVAFHGGVFRYKTTELNRNEIPSTVQRERYFGGIPEDKLPVKVAEVKKDNLTEMVGRVDLGIYPENARRIYEILKILEKEQPILDLPVKPGDKFVMSRRVYRAGEAEFFLNHLPKGLKPWAEKQAS